MKVWLKNELLPFHQEIIKNISIQNHGKAISLSSGRDGDTMKLVQMDVSPNVETDSQKIDFTQLELPSSVKIRQSIAVMAWSPDDQFLAVAGDKLVVYRYIQNQGFQKLKEYAEHEIEIMCITWSPDSSCIASGAMDRKIVVNDIKQEKKVFQTKVESKIMGMVWDTYDKYLAILQGDNNVVIWKTSSFEKQFEICLNFPGTPNQIHNCKREDRKIDWSSDYRYLLVPSLDDKIVPVVCALDRNQDFKVSQVFMGPFSSINCIKFNPNLFNYEDNIINIFALGDNDGNISVWGIGEGFQQKKPFILLKSHKNGSELIEDLSWNKEGNILISTTMKRYLFIATFSDGLFGQRLNKEERKLFLEGQYGGVRNQSQGRQFKVFKACNYENNDEAQKNQINDQNNALQQQQINQAQQQQSKQQLVFTQQKVITQGGKKRIIPSVQVQKAVSEQQQQQSNQQTIHGNINTNGNSVQMEEEKVQSVNNQNQQQQQQQQEIVVVNVENKDVEFVQKDPKKPVQQTCTLQKKRSDMNCNLTQQQQQQQQIQQQISKQDKKFELTKPQPIPEQYSYPISNTSVLQFSKLRVPMAQLQQQSQNAEEDIQEMRIQQKIICTVTTNRGGKEIQWSAILEGQILCMERSQNYLYFYTEENLLYVFDYNGRRFDLPFIAHSVCYMRASKCGKVCTLDQEGILKVQDIPKKENCVEEDIGLLIKENLEILQKMQASQKTKDPIQNIIFDDNGLVILQFKTGNLYFFSKENKAWHRLDSSIFEVGVFQNLLQRPEMVLSSVATNNNSNVIPNQGAAAQVQKGNNTNKFFELLMISDADIAEIRQNDMQLASKLEERVLFITKYTKNQSNTFKEQFMRLCKTLCDLREINKFRQLIIDTFINQTERYFVYLCDNNVDKKQFFNQITAVCRNYPFMHQILEELETLISL